LCSKKEYYDLYIDVPGRTLTINDHAKEIFRLTKYHKTTAEQLVAVAAEQPDKEIITAVAKKTNELRKKIESLGDDLSLEKLSEMKLPPNMDRFLFNVAKAEGLIKDKDISEGSGDTETAGGEKEATPTPSTTSSTTTADADADL